MEFTVRDHLRNNIAVLDRKVYMLKAPKDVTTPYVVMHKISDSRSEFGTRSPRYQFSVFDKSYGQAREIADKIRTAIKELDGLSNIFAPYDEEDREIYEDDSSVFHIAIDAIFYYDTGETW